MPKVSFIGWIKQFKLNKESKDIVLDRDELFIYRAKWSMSATVMSLIYVSAIYGIFLLGAIASGSITGIFWVCLLGCAIYLPPISAFNEKEVVLSDKRVIVKSGVFGNNFVSLPLEKIDVVKVSHKSIVEIKAGSFFNNLVLPLVDTPQFAEALERARTANREGSKK
jgi:hypothetical protein